MTPVERGRVVLSWSGGKDSALSLHSLLRTPGVEVAGLLTTVTADYQRISMHGVRRVLLERQAASLGLPLHVVEISAGAGNAEYEARFGEALSSFHQRGIATVAYGDLFLEDIRAYRVAMTERLGMSPIFPVWGRDTAALANDFVGGGFRARLVCVDSRALDGAFAGREYDAALLRDLPPGVDPCGENGEFHTFVSDGPDFREPVPYDVGEVVLRDGRFVYCDLLPG